MVCNFYALLRSFRALSRPFAPFCALFLADLRVHFLCAFLRSFACFSERSLGPPDPGPRKSPEKVKEQSRKYLIFRLFLDFSELFSDFFGVLGRGVPNSSRETFFKAFRVFGVLGCRWQGRSQDYILLINGQPASVNKPGENPLQLPGNLLADQHMVPPPHAVPRLLVF